MKKTVIGLFYILIFIMAMVFNSNSVVSHAAGAEFAHKIISYQASSMFGNPNDGIKIKGFFSEEATDFTVTYTAVKIYKKEDIVTVDSDTGVILMNGNEIKDNDIVVKDSGKEENILTQVHNVSNPTPNKSKYIEVVANEWCAFVFAVHYVGINNENLITYASNVYTCTTIDSGTPEVYKNSRIDYADYVEYDIMIRSDKIKQAQSKDTGLDYFVVYKGKSIADNQKIEIDRVKNIGKTFYIYRLAVSLKEVAVYEIYAVDNAGNKVLQVIAENYNKTDDEGFESSANNVLADLKNNALYAPTIRDNIEKAYNDYYMQVQKSDILNADDVADINKERSKTQVYLNEYWRLKALERINKKEWTLKITNQEYVSGDVTLENADIAFATLLYGEQAQVNISLASFVPSKVNKKVEMQVAGVKSCKEILSLTIVYSKNNMEFKEVFSKPLQIAVPLKKYEKVKAVINIPRDDGSYDIKTIDITEYNDYIVLNTTYSYGTISLFIDEKTHSPLLWLFTLLIIPVGIFVFMIVLVIKKNKKKVLEGKNDKHGKKGRNNSKRKTSGN